MPVKYNIHENEEQLNVTLNCFVDFLANQQKIESENQLLQALIDIYNAINSETTPSNNLYCFDLSDKEIDKTIKEMEGKLLSQNPQIDELKSILTYFWSEIIDNMQQHSHSLKGYAYTNYNSDKNFIDIVLADGGVSIIGSYVTREKHLDKIQNDADAIHLAKNGYSTKDDNNRGFGLSTNIKIVTKGLGGEFAIISGNAIYLQKTEPREVAFSDKMDWKGTLIIARIPAQKPDNFNLINYLE